VGGSRATGRIGVVGVYNPVKRYNQQLRDLIIRGKARHSADWRRRAVSPDDRNGERGRTPVLH
jgi:hypothetical protein